MDLLLAYIKNIIPVSDALQNDLALLFSPIQLKKEEYLAIEGRVETKLAFINSGVLRAFFVVPTAKSTTKLFLMPLLLWEPIILLSLVILII